MIKIEEISSMIEEARNNKISFWYLAGYESIIVSSQDQIGGSPESPENLEWYKMGQEDALGDLNAQT